MLSQVATDKMTSDLKKINRAAMYYGNSDLRPMDLPYPRIGDREILMRVEASGICGSDVMEWYRKDKIPLVLGHEVAGTIVEVGVEVKDFKIEDRIVATHHVPCFQCEYCRDGHPTVCETLRQTHFDPGGFAQFIRIPEINARLGTFPLPDHLSFEEGTFVEPLGCVIRGQRLAGMKKGRRVLVIGSGMAGLLHILLARLSSAEYIIATDIDSYRLKMARKMGADEIINAGDNVLEKVKEFSQGRLPNLVIICSGAETAIEQGLRSVDRGGLVLIFTATVKDAHWPVPLNDLFWRTEVSLLSSYAAAPEDLKQALALIAEKKIPVQPMITHRLPLREIQRGFDLVTHPRDSIKVIIEPHK